MKMYTRKDHFKGSHMVTWYCSRRDKAYTIKKRGDGVQDAFDKLNRAQRSQITYDGDRVTQERI